MGKAPVDLTEDEIIKVLSQEIHAFPGVTTSMLWPRLTQRLSKEWRPVLQKLFDNGTVIRIPKKIDNRAILVNYWRDDLPKDTSMASIVAPEFVEVPADVEEVELGSPMTIDSPNGSSEGESGSDDDVAAHPRRRPAVTDDLI